MGTMFGNSGLSAAVEALVEGAVEASLHDSEPDSEGSNELSGGDYERKSVEWTSATAGQVNVSGDLEFEVPGDTWVRWVGLWTEDDEFIGAVELETQVEYENPGPYTVSPFVMRVQNPTNDE